MGTLKSIGRFGLPVLAVFLILSGLGLLGVLAVSPVLMGILALVAGVLILMAT